MAGGSSGHSASISVSRCTGTSGFSASSPQHRPLPGLAQSGPRAVAPCLHRPEDLELQARSPGSSPALGPGGFRRAARERLQPGGIQAERPGQPGHRAGAGAVGPALLQIPDRAQADLREVSELPLSQPGRAAADAH